MAKLRALAPYRLGPRFSGSGPPGRVMGRWVVLLRPVIQLGSYPLIPVGLIYVKAGGLPGVDVPLDLADCYHISVI
jgi:hypothetical protein